MDHASPSAFILIILLVGPALWFIRKARRGQSIFIRRIPGIDAVDQAIGRTVELGRPMIFTSGLISVNPLLYACLGVLKYVARRAAVFGARLFVPCSDPEVMVLCDMTVQNSYRAENRFSKYDPSSVRFLSSEQFAYASGYMGMVHREQVGSAFLFGTFAAESLILAEAGQQVGAMQVAATTSNEQIPFFITSCDYTVIGEELYAAGAYLSDDPVQRGSLRGQDIAKFFIVFIILCGVAEATVSTIVSGAGHSKEKTSVAEWINKSWSDLKDDGGEKDAS